MIKRCLTLFLTVIILITSVNIQEIISYAAEVDVKQEEITDEENNDEEKLCKEQEIEEISNSKYTVEDESIVEQGIISSANNTIKSYQNYKPLPALTGNKRIDAANIAYSQIGYTEGSGNLNAYGPQDEWCVYFARWCAIQAGLASDKWLYTGSTNTLIGWFQSQGRWHNRDLNTWNVSSKGSKSDGTDDGYIPQPGDFAAVENGIGIGDTSTNNAPDHTALVYGVDDQYIYTVEGNVGNQVVQRQYNRSNLHYNSSTYIVGFGEPDYGDSGQQPLGVVDIISGGEGTVRVRGWAFDYDDPSAQLDIHVYVGGEGHSITANLERTDVNATYGGNIGNYHGFDSTFNVNVRGEQQVEVYAIDTHDKWIGNPLIGSGTVNIKNIPFSITYENDSINSNVDDSTNINFNFTGDGIYTMSYEIADSSVIKFNGFTAVDWGTGTATINITALKSGNTTLNMCLLDSNYQTLFSKKIPIYVSQSVTGISLNKTNLSMQVGDEENLIATIQPENAGNKSITWTSSDKSIARVSSTGTVVAKSAGTATITVKTSDGKYTATCKIIVTQPVLGVSLNKSSTTIAAGQTEQLFATVTPTDATNTSVTWTSSNTSVASVNDGIVTANAAGTATITVKTNDGGYSASCDVTVTQTTIETTGVSLNKSNTTLMKGNSETLTATVSPANATDKSVSWSSSNENIVTVSNGTITAITAGTATITVKTNDGGYSASCKVTVTQPVTGVSLNKSSTTITNGNSETLVATVAPSNATNKSVTWMSSNSNVASVTDGTVTANAVGTATITVTTNDGGYSASCDVTVTQATIETTGVSLNKSNTTLMKGNSETLTATVTPTNATNKSVSWSSSNTSVASVTDGTVTANAVGTATITVTTNDGGYSASCDVTVTQATIETTGVSLNKSNTTLMKGNSETLTATVSPANATDKSVSWSSSNENIVTVNNGTITAITAGTATITVKTNDGGYTATCDVTVTEKQALEIQLDNGIGEVGSTGYMTYSYDLHGEILQNMNWASSDSSIISIDENSGLMQLLKPGTVTITLNINGVTATATMKSISINIEPSEITLKEEEQKNLTVKVLPDMTDYSTISWESDNHSVATINNGIVTAHKEGSATISCSYGPYKAQCTVNVIADNDESDKNEEDVVPDGLWITGVTPTITYTGSAIKQNISVYHGKTLLRENSEYKISYKNNKNAGIAQIIVNGKGNYTGKATEAFTIEAIDLSTDSNVSINVSTAKETGKKLKPKVNVTWKGKKLKENKDYVLSYNSNIIVASEDGYDITINGTGNYTGSVQRKFYVEEKDTPLLNNANVTGIAKSYFYDNGNPVGPNLDNITVKLNKKTLAKDTDYTIRIEDNCHAGTGTVIIEPAAQSRYSGEKYIHFKIIGTNLKNGSILGLNKEYPYTGESITPSFYVFSDKNGCGEEIPSDSYTVTYNNNINQGKATITITGIEEKGVSGKLTATFKIKKLDINNKNITIEMPDTSIYAKGGSKPLPVITYNYNNRTWNLREGVDYSLTYNNNTSRNGKKTPTLKITGLGNYTGTVTKTYDIVEQDIGQLTITVTDKAYNAKKKGNYYLSLPKIYDKDGKLLKKNTDYTVKYVNKSTGQEINENDIINSGTEILVTATGIGNYTGVLSTSYYVRDIHDINKVKADKITVQQYTGKEIKPDVKLYVKEGNTTFYLTEGTDYQIVGYYNNIKKGKASVIIKGIGEYSGSKVINFKIVSVNNRSIWEGIFN